MNQDFELLLWWGVFFSWLFFLTLNLIEEAQSSLISYLAKLAHRSNRQWNRNSKRSSSVSASATLIKPAQCGVLKLFREANKNQVLYFAMNILLRVTFDEAICYLFVIVLEAKRELLFEATKLSTKSNCGLIVPISRVFRESLHFSRDYRLNFNFMIWEGNIYISRLFAARGKLTQKWTVKVNCSLFFQAPPSGYRSHFGPK